MKMIKFNFVHLISALSCIYLAIVALNIHSVDCSPLNQSLNVSIEKLTNNTHGINVDPILEKALSELTNCRQKTCINLKAPETRHLPRGADADLQEYPTGKKFNLLEHLSEIKDYSLRIQPMVEQVDDETYQFIMNVKVVRNKDNRIEYNFNDSSIIKAPELLGNLTQINLQKADSNKKSIQGNPAIENDNYESNSSPLVDKKTQSQDGVTTPTVFAADESVGTDIPPLDENFGESSRKKAASEEETISIINNEKLSDDAYVKTMETIENITKSHSNTNDPDESDIVSQPIKDVSDSSKNSIEKLTTNIPTTTPDTLDRTTQQNRLHTPLAKSVIEEDSSRATVELTTEMPKESSSRHTKLNEFENSSSTTDSIDASSTPRLISTPAAVLIKTTRKDLIAGRANHEENIETITKTSVQSSLIAPTTPLNPLNQQSLAAKEILDNSIPSMSLTEKKRAETFISPKKAPETPWTPEQLVWRVGEKERSSNEVRSNVDDEENSRRNSPMIKLLGGVLANSNNYYQPINPPQKNLLKNDAGHYPNQRQTETQYRPNQGPVMPNYSSNYPPPAIPQYTNTNYNKPNNENSIITRTPNKQGSYPPSRIGHRNANTVPRYQYQPQPAVQPVLYHHNRQPYAREEIVHSERPNHSLPIQQYKPSPELFIHIIRQYFANALTPSETKYTYEHKPPQIISHPVNLSPKLPPSFPLSHQNYNS